MIPADGTGYSFSGTGGDVFLAPTAGYAFPPGTVTEWHFLLSDVPCVVAPVEITVPAPGFADTTCDAPAGIILTDFPNGSWSWGGTGGESFTGEPANMRFGVAYTVTAVADAGFVVPATFEWTHTFAEPTGCGGGGGDEPVSGVMLPSVFEDSCGPDNEVLTLPLATDGVTYAETSYLDADGVTVLVVTATAAHGYVLSGAVSQEFPVNDEPCQVTPPGPVVDPPGPVVDPPGPVVDPPAPVVDPADPVATPPLVETADPPATPVVVATAHTTVLPSTGSNDGELSILAMLLCLAGVGVFTLGRTRLVRRPLPGLVSDLADDRALRAGNATASRTNLPPADGPHRRE